MIAEETDGGGGGAASNTGSHCGGRTATGWLASASVLATLYRYWVGDVRQRALGVCFSQDSVRLMHAEHAEHGHKQGETRAAQLRHGAKPVALAAAHPRANMIV